MKLTDREWKPILIASYFSFVRGSENNMALLEVGDIPLISAKNGNNGLKGFVSTSKTIISGNCITLNNDGDGGAGLAYYQPADMALDTHVTALVPKVSISMLAMLFISECLSKLHGFFGHGLSISNERAEKIRIMLPINEKDEPDFQFMADYIQNKMQEKQKQYHQFVEKRIRELELNNASYPSIHIEGKEWKPISIVSIFDTLVSGKGKGLNHLEQVNHGISYISATNRNNGVTCFVKEDNNSVKMLQEGNCIGFIKNGDGSAGFAIYKQEPFISTNDVIYGYAKWLNQYTGLFFVVAQDMIERKYSHGYKRNAHHLRGDRVMLPVDENGYPDYAFMEQYGKMLVARKYQQYLNHLDGRKS